ncbi:MAG: hypothetical protein MUP98_18415, partial [Candidatus Aminicenantes bacterium]|nr:hypothetical protein [Candidatus Aminicenantes bacterium]
MKGKIFAIICLLIFTSFLTLNAQWARTYGGSDDEYARTILQTSDGGYIVFGRTESFDANIWVIKLNISGDIEWQKTYGEEFNIFTLNAYSIQKTNDGGYIIGASNGIAHFSHQFWVIKLSANGDIIWQKNYGDEAVNYVYSLQQTNDGGYIVAGHTGYEDGRGYDFLIIKLSFDGTIEWSKTYRGSLDDKPSSILLTSDGGYIVAGYTESYGAGGFDIWILKLASDGTIEWQKTYGGSESEQANSFQHTNDGGYIVAGRTDSYGAGQADFWVLKISSEGDIEWNKIYGGSKNEIAYSIQQTFDGGYIVAGETESFGAGNKDCWVLKLNILGGIDWQKTYGGSQVEEGSSIMQTNDGGYIVAGSTFSYGAGKRDIFVLKLFSNGDINSSCGLRNDSNAEVSDTDISPANTFIETEPPDLQSGETNMTPNESEAVVYSLCSGVQHTLSLSVSTGGKTIPQAGTYIYDYAERISISAYPDEGYIFSLWSGDISSTVSSLSITMDSDKSIKANFIEDIIEEI